MIITSKELFDKLRNILELSRHDPNDEFSIAIADLLIDLLMMNEDDLVEYDCNFIDNLRVLNGVILK